MTVRRLHVQAFAATAVLLPIAALWLNGNPLRPRHFVEGALVLAVFSLVATPAIVRAFSALAGWRQAAVAATAAAVIGGQLIGMPARTYPFVSWYMYASATPPNRFARYEVEYESGRSGLLPVERISPSSSPRAFLSSLSVTGGTTLPEMQPERLRELETLLDHLVGAYNQRHPEDRITAVRVVRCVVPLQDGVAGSPECTQLAMHRYAGRS